MLISPTTADRLSLATMRASALEAHAAIEHAARTQLHAHRGHLVETMTVGEFIRQGDLYCLRIERDAATWNDVTPSAAGRDTILTFEARRHHVIEGRDLTILQSPEQPEDMRNIHRFPKSLPLQQALGRARALHPSLLRFLSTDTGDWLGRRRGDLRFGPLIIARNRFQITHPEHAHFSLPAGIYLITFQIDPTRNGRAVRD